MKRWMLVLVICLPLASVAFGGVMAYFAFSLPDDEVLSPSVTLSKTSWRDDRQQDQR